jgi:N-methylhydantoinase A
VLEIRRANREELYDILWDPPEPLVRRRHRLEVDERVDYSGAVVTPLDEDSVRDVARKLRAREIESVAICLINAHMNPAHERRRREILLEELPGLHLSLSTDILPEPPEFERTATTVANAYCAPVLRRYMDALEERLGEAVTERRRARHAQRRRDDDDRLRQGRAVKTLNSGPAAGVIAAPRWRPRRPPERRRLRHGRDERRHRGRARRRAAADALVRPRVGHAIQLPEHRRRLVGAGGGSIAWLDPGRLPAQRPAERRCRIQASVLRQGRTEPDQHDAQLVLGRVSNDLFLDGRMSSTSSARPTRCAAGSPSRSASASRTAAEGRAPDRERQTWVKASAS